MISEERLQRIGRMIGIYREERKGNSQNCWSQKRFCSDICSPNTLKRIEQGDISRSLAIYVEMLKKFKLKLNEFPAIDEAVLLYTKKLYDAIEFYHIEEVIDILNKLLRILQEVSQYVYYSELKELFESVKNYYQDEKDIVYSNIEHFMQIMVVMPIEFQDLYRFLLYSKIKATSIEDMNVYLDNVKRISLDQCSANFVKLGLLDYYYITSHYFKMNALLNELEKTFIEQQNWIRLYDVYSCAIVLLSKTEFDKCVEYIHRVEENILKYDVPEIKKGELYSNIAIAYQIHDDYEIALRYYEKMRELHTLDYIDSFIFMADCQNHLNQTIDIPKIEESTYNQYPLNVKLMYKYFLLKDDVPDFVKENYILKKLLPTFQDDAYIEVFRFELLRLIDHTNHYKMIHVFESKIKSNKKRR